MMRKLSLSTLVLTLAVLLAATGAFAVKPPPTTNVAPEVTAFDVPDESASPIPVLAFTASDADGTIAGYLITESSAKPDASTPGWTATAPTEYATSSVGTVTLYAWAMDNGGAISNSKSDTVTIPDPLLQRLAALEAQVAALQTTLAEIQSNPALDLGAYVSVEPNYMNQVIGPHIIFTGANVHIRSGSGATMEDPLTGLGNLIIGYNEVGNNFTGRAGSHNLVVGPEHDWIGIGGLLAGYDNKVLGPYGVAVGGYTNVASGWGSGVFGGGQNCANATRSSVLGGSSNTARGGDASLVGGFGNSADAAWSVVTGGRENTAAGYYSTVSGGRLRIAPDMWNWAAGSLLELE